MPGPVIGSGIPPGPLTASPGGPEGGRPLTLPRPRADKLKTGFAFWENLRKISCGQGPEKKPQKPGRAWGRGVASSGTGRGSSAVAPKKAGSVLNVPA